MESNVKHLNPSDASRHDMDRLVFAMMGHMKHFFVVEKPMTRKEAAEYLGVSLPTLDRLVSKGTVRRHIVEDLSIPFFLPSELHQLIKNS